MSLSPRELVERFGSPLFVYDGDAIAERYRRLRAALPESAVIHYAVKANPSLGVLALLVREGAGLEIASEGELAAVLRGVMSQRLVPRADGGRCAAIEVLVGTRTVRDFIEGGKRLKEIKDLIEEGYERRCPEPFRHGNGGVSAGSEPRESAGRGRPRRVTFHDDVQNPSDRISDGTR